jgi:hypothetical protein
LGVPIQRNPLNCIFVLPNCVPCPLLFSFFFIWSSIGFSPVFSHSIILLITSGHRTFIILRRQRFIKVCIFCVIKFVTLVINRSGKTECLKE